MNPQEPQQKAGSASPALTGYTNQVAQSGPSKSEPLRGGRGVEALLAELDRYWSFDNNQQHTHSWHDKQDFLERWRGAMESVVSRQDYDEKQREVDQARTTRREFQRLAKKKHLQDAAEIVRLKAEVSDLKRAAGVALLTSRRQKKNTDAVSHAANNQQP